MRPSSPVPAVLLALALAGCVSAGGLAVRATDRIAPGTYRTLFYSAYARNDLLTVVILDRDGDGWTIEPLGAPSDFRVSEGQSGEEALAAARPFFRLISGFNRVATREIRGPGGEMIGYELRPLYQPFVHGMEDVLDTSYRQRGDNTIAADIRVSPIMEMRDFRRRH